MKIILFGSSGMLGRYVFSVLRKTYEVICIKRSDFDIENDSWSKLKNLLKSRLNYGDVIINCAGVIPQYYKADEQNTKMYIRVNTLFPHKLNEIALEKNYKFIHISTDFVFDGNKGNYLETDKHTGKNLYEISKSLGEPEEALIIRTSIVGEELHGKKSFIEWLKTHKNGIVNGFTNSYWNGVTCLGLANLIKKIIDENLYWTGVRHIFSPNSISKYDLCNYINSVYELNIKVNAVENSVKRDLTLKSIFDKNLCYEMDSIYNQLKEQKEYKLENYGEYKIISECRFCGNSDLTDIMKFNDFPLSGAFIKNEDYIMYEKIYPLSLLYCEKCNTGLIKEVVTSDNLFTNINQSGYFYFSSTIKALVDHFHNLSNKIKQLYPEKYSILEIGCNDGVFLNNFVSETNNDGNNNKYKLIGVDPSQTIKKIVSDKVVKYNDYFNQSTTDLILKEHGKQDIIVCCNCLAHIDDIGSIYSNIKRLMKPDAVLIIEVHYFKNIIDNLNFDFIYHEHMSYYTITTIINICQLNNLYLENIEFIDTHGGSLRAFIRHAVHNNRYYNANKLDKYLIEYEQDIKTRIKGLFDNLIIWKGNLISLIEKVKNNNDNEILVGYGASGRTNMIINYLSVKFDIIVDDSQNKIDSYMPYYHTKIMNSKHIYSDKRIKTIFILAWPYTKTIITNHIKFLEEGGTFYKILPTIEILIVIFR